MSTSKNITPSAGEPPELEDAPKIYATPFSSIYMLCAAVNSVPAPPDGELKTVL